MIEEELIEQFRNADGRGIKYLALDLITKNYDACLLVKLANEKGVGQKLGYVADLAAIAAKNQGLADFSKLEKVAEILYLDYRQWRFLDLEIPEYAKRLIIDRSNTELNNKWRIYSSLTVSELEDWVDLYITKKYVTTPREQRAGQR